MGKVEIKLQSSYVTKTPRKDREPTVFRRSIKKLSEDKLHPGRILRVFIKIDNDYKVFGVFTINTGGSISFFPDFFNIQDQFDHLTLNKDFINKKGHLTKVENTGKHKKVYPVGVSELPSGSYHLMTFGMKDGDLLMDSLEEICYPDIEFEDRYQEQFLALLQDAIHTDLLMLDFPEEPGSYFIQVLIVPKGKSVEELSIETSFSKFFSLKKPISDVLNAKKLKIETPEKFDFYICLICFKISEELAIPFGICM